MGVWMIGTGVLKIEPAPGEDLLKEYIDFSAKVKRVWYQK